MAALQCEICGGKLIGKSGGVFECDSCGMQYDRTRVQEMVQEIKGTVKIEGPVEVTGTVKVEGGGPTVETLFKRAQMALEDENWQEAGKLYRQIIEVDPENARAYAGKLCAWLEKSSLEDVAKECSHTADLEGNNDFQKALRFADDALRAELEQCLETVRENQRLREEEEARQQRLREEEENRQKEEEARQRDEDERRRRENPVRLKPLRERAAKAARFIAAGAGHTVCLKVDGTVVAAGRNDKGQCNVTDWTDIVAVSAGYNHTVGLKSDGTVVAVGNNANGECDVSGWRDIVAVIAAASNTTGLRADGTVVTTDTFLQNEVPDWTDIVMVSVGCEHFVGLRTDGTVVAAGCNDYGECDVSDWTDIVAVSAGVGCTAGLRADGTVVSTYEYDQEKVPNWRDIVAVSAYFGTVGLRADGTVVVGSCNVDVSGWWDIAAVAVGDADVIVGLRADGTVVAVGSNDDGQCNVSGWKLFDNIDTLEREYEEAEAERQRQKADAKARAEAERQKKIAALEAEKQSVQVEIANCKGLFSGGKRRELEARLAKVEAKLLVGADDIAVNSPATGNVFKVKCFARQSVNAGDVLITLMTVENIKMEVGVFAPVAGTVKAVTVELGAAVRTGDLLVILS